MNFHMINNAFQVIRMKGGFYRRKPKNELSKSQFKNEGIFLIWTLN